MNKMQNIPAEAESKKIHICYFHKVYTARLQSKEHETPGGQMQITHRIIMCM